MTPAPTTRVSLSEDIILEAGIRIAEERGIQAVTMRTLGEVLGVDSTAPYRYFRDKEELLSALINRMMLRMVDRFPATDDWRQDLRTVAFGIRDSVQRHPDFPAIFMSLSQSRLDLSTFTDPVLNILERAGLTGRPAIVAYQMFESVISGVSFLDVAGAPDHWSNRFNRYRSVRSLRPLQWVPNAQATEDVATEAFARLVESVIDSIAALADESAAQH